MTHKNDGEGLTRGIKSAFITPFGSTHFSQAMLKIQQEIDERRARARSDESRHQNFDGKTHKWAFLRALTEARAAFDLSDRAIHVLEALLSFHPSEDIDGRETIIVFPSNKELSLRSRGMAPATLRRHLASLGRAGLIQRRDSPNGKRYCRRGEGGLQQEAFGFDISPVGLMADQVFEAAEKAREDAREIELTRIALTNQLRDIRKIIDAAFNVLSLAPEAKFKATEGQGGASVWYRFKSRLDGLSGRVGRHTPLEAHTTRLNALIRLRAEVEDAFLTMDEAYRQPYEEPDFNHIACTKNHNMSGKEDISERHIQNSNTDRYLDKGYEDKKKPNPASKGLSPNGMPDNGKRHTAPITPEGLALLCPEITHYTRNGLKQWGDAMAAAEIIRPILDISPSAWRDARQNMGDYDAIITLACILERHEEIRSAGGYLRKLTERAIKGQFSVKPMLDALRNKKVPRE